MRAFARSLQTLGRLMEGQELGESHRRSREEITIQTYLVETRKALTH